MDLPSQQILLPISSFLVCAVCHQLALRVFPRVGLLDFPERYGLKRAKLPYPTGIIAVVSFLLFYLYLEGVSKQTFGLTIGILLLTSFSFADDRHRISPSIRLLVQIAAAVIIFGFGTRIYSITNPLVTNGVIKLDTIVLPISLFDNPPLWSGVFTILWLGLTINALNWFDGIPGQVSTLSTIGFVTIGVLALRNLSAPQDPILLEQQQEVARLAFVLAGIAAACHIFDFPPNRVLMGDTGAMFFGLMLGVLTIYGGGKVATAFLVLGVPLIDCFIVVARRLAKGASPLRGNAHDEHLHHRLLSKGWSEQRVIYMTAVLGLVFGVSALYLSTREKFLSALVLFGVMLWLSWYSRPQKKTEG